MSKGKRDALQVGVGLIEGRRATPWKEGVEPRNLQFHGAFVRIDQGVETKQTCLSRTSVCMDRPEYFAQQGQFIAESRSAMRKLL